MLYVRAYNGGSQIRSAHVRVCLHNVTLFQKIDNSIKIPICGPTIRSLLPFWQRYNYCTCSVHLLNRNKIMTLGNCRGSEGRDSKAQVEGRKY
jgi:hypothetical protein